MEAITLQQENAILRRQISEMMRKKQSDSIWSREKKKLRERVIKEFGFEKSYQITDCISTIARRILNKRTVVTFTESDVETINLMFDYIIEAVKKVELKQVR